MKGGTSKDFGVIDTVKRGWIGSPKINRTYEILGEGGVENAL